MIFEIIQVFNKEYPTMLQLKKEEDKSWADMYVYIYIWKLQSYTW